MVGVTGIEPAASRSQSARSTTELHPAENQRKLPISFNLLVLGKFFISLSRFDAVTLSLESSE